jgi:hypothetical protein
VTEVPPPAASINYPADIPGETAQAMFDRAYAAANKPWISAASKAAVISYAGSAPLPTTAAQRRQRFYAVQALILGGPDGQVM